MKRYKIYIKAFYILSSVMMAGLTACNKKLDLKPYQQIDQSQAIQTAADVQITLTGAYSRAGQVDLYGGGIFLYPDLMADQAYVRWQGTYQQLTQMYNQSILNGNSFINNVWLDSYQVINQANNVLANIGKVDTANRNSVAGQAKFLRGLVYFDMARLFGRAWNDGDPNTNLAVPIILTPTTVISSSSYVSRATVAQVYKQAIADLTDAEKRLSSGSAAYASTSAASAILARLYLQQGDYVNAAVEANKVISSGTYKLVDYATEFSYPVSAPAHIDNTSEDIFALQVTSQQGSNYLNTFYASSYFSGRGDIILRNTFLDTFEPNDARLAVYDNDPDGVLRVDKYDNLYGNVHVVRLAEMYLIRAESNFRKSSAVGATPLSDINTIRARAGLAPRTSVSINNILAERVHELAFEGFFLHDAKRLQGAIDPATGAITTNKIGGLDYNSPKLVFPIPFQDITANPNLKQNPGY